MSTTCDSTPLSQTIPQALTETAAECPLHIAMREMARLAVTQHVLYLEGECLPRPDITRDLEIWTSLYGLVSTRLCVATHTTPLDREELATAIEGVWVGVVRPRTYGRAPQDLEKTLSLCPACALSTYCPLGDSGDVPSTSQFSQPNSSPWPEDKAKRTRVEAAGESQHEV